MGYGTVVDGFARFQALSSGISALKFQRISTSNKQNKGFYCKSMPHLLPADICPGRRGAGGWPSKRHLGPNPHLGVFDSMTIPPSTKPIHA